MPWASWLRQLPIGVSTCCLVNLMIRTTSEITKDEEDALILAAVEADARWNRCIDKGGSCEKCIKCMMCGHHVSSHRDRSIGGKGNHYQCATCMRCQRPELPPDVNIRIANIMANK